MKKIMAICACIYLLASCKKNDNDGTDPVTYDNYLPLKVGNYWVYEEYNLDTLGNYTSTGVIDSDYIANDTLANGFTYYNWVRKNFVGVPAGGYVRDSLHYIVDVMGTKIFSSQNFIDTLDDGYSIANTDTLYYRYNKMDNPNSSVIVPAGSFVTDNSKTIYILYPPLSGSGYSPRTLNLRYAKDVGLVYETIVPFASDPNYRVKKLLRYHLN